MTDAPPWTLFYMLGSVIAILIFGTIGFQAYSAKQLRSLYAHLLTKEWFTLDDLLEEGFSRARTAHYLHVLHALDALVIRPREGLSPEELAKLNTAGFVPQTLRLHDMRVVPSRIGRLAHARYRLPKTPRNPGDGSPA